MDGLFGARRMKAHRTGYADCQIIIPRRELDCGSLRGPREPGSCFSDRKVDDYAEEYTNASSLLPSVVHASARCGTKYLRCTASAECSSVRSNVPAVQVVVWTYWASPWLCLRCAMCHDSLSWRQQWVARGGATHWIRAPLAGLPKRADKLTL